MHSLHYIYLVYFVLATVVPVLCTTFAHRRHHDEHTATRGRLRFARHTFIVACVRTWHPKDANKVFFNFNIFRRRYVAGASKCALARRLRDLSRRWIPHPIIAHQPAVYRRSVCTCAVISLYLFLEIRSYWEKNVAICGVPVYRMYVILLAAGKYLGTRRQIN